MNVLVTGASGFLGRALTRALLQRGEDVVAFDIVPAGLERVAELGATTVRGDLGAWNDVLGAITEHDVRRVFHCGALLSAAAEADPTGTYRAKADGTYHVLEAARMLDLERVVFTSTMAVFGRAAGDPVLDDAPQWPATIYGATKVFGERLVEYHHGRYGVDARAVRYPSVVGYGRGPEGASAHTSLVFDRPARGEPYRLHVSPDVRSQLVHVDDAVGALLALDGVDASALSRRIYNVGGISPTAAELVKSVRKVLAGADLGFEPRPDLERIVRSGPLRLEDSAARRDWGLELTLDDPAAIAERVVTEAEEHGA
jgi:threonine 3-dehydrogenase